LLIELGYIEPLEKFIRYKITGKNEMGLIKVGLRLLSAVIVLALVACGDPDNKQTNEVHLERAAAYQEQGQYKAAIIEYKNAVKRSKGGVEVILQYSKMLNTLGHYVAALSLLEQSTGKKTEAYYLVLIETFMGMNKYLSAEATLKDYITSSSHEIEFLEAEIQFGLGELKAASELYDQILAKDDSDNSALLGKAKILARDGNTSSDAVFELLNRIQKQSDYYNKGRILTAGIQLSKNQLEAAEATLSELLSLLSNTDIIEPEKALVLERLAYVLTRQGRTNEAYIYTKLLAEAFPGANEIQEKYKSAVEKFQAKELDEAQKILLAIVEEYPSYKKAIQLLGVISYLHGDNELASKYLSGSVDPEVASPMVKHIYAATNLKLNDPKKVLEILEEGIEQSNSPENLALYGLAAISDKQFSKGERALLKAIEIDATNIRIRLALAGFYRTGLSANKGKEWEQLQQAFMSAPTDKIVLKEVVSFQLRVNGIEKATAFISDALKEHSGDYATNLIAGYFFANQSAYQKALGYFTVAAQAKKEGGEYLTALFAQGRAELSLNRLAAAEKTFKEIITASPKSMEGYKGLLSTYSMEGGIENGQNKLAVLARESNVITPTLVLIQASIDRKDVDQASAYLDMAKKIDSQHTLIEGYEMTINYVKAVKAVQQRKFDEARELIAPVLVAQPDNMRVLAFLVELELSAGKLSEAAKVLKQIEALNSSNPIVVLLKGELALKNKDLEGARKQFEKVWVSSPSEVAGEKLFKILGMLKQKSAQDEHLEDWVTKFPNNPPAVLFQAVNDQQKGERSKAVTGYEKVLKVAPNSVMALNNLGWIYFEKGDDAALKLLKKAADLAPESAAVLDSYGWVLAKSGQVDEGLVYLEKANQLSPETQEIADHLATAKKM